MTATKRMTRDNTLAERAQLWGYIYYELGPARSLIALRKHGADAGLDTPALSTLKDWSSRFNWQQMIARLNLQAQQRRDLAVIETREQVELRQAALGRALQDAAAEGLKLWTNAPKAIQPADAARTGRDGVNIERNALGMATERKEIVVLVINEFVRDLMRLFVTVNILDLPQDREAQFAEGVRGLSDRLSRQA